MNKLNKPLKLFKMKVMGEDLIVFFGINKMVKIGSKAV